MVCPKIIERKTLQELEKAIKELSTRYHFRLSVIGYSIHPITGKYSALMLYNNGLIEPNDQTLSPSEIEVYDRNTLAGFIKHHGEKGISDQFELTPEEEKRYLSNQK